MSVFRNLQKHSRNLCKSTYLCSNVYITRLLSSLPTEYGRDRDPAPLFFNSEVQSLLKSLTRPNLSKVYRKRKLGGKALEQPTYKFMTDEQLQETLMEAKRRVEDLLQMPPVVQVREPINRVFVNDPALQGLDSSKFIFTDVTFGIEDCDRLIVVREPDGVLREANWEERDRINQLYFPKVCRKIKVPQMFTKEELLKDLLARGEYEFVLDRACTQFEPDHPDYQRITSVTYQHINEHNNFEVLRSTRHFGPLTFYLTWFKSVDNLLLELIETAHIENANDLLKLYGKMHEIQFSIKDSQSLDGVNQYIATETQKKGPLGLAVQAYKDLEKQRRQLQQGIQAAHGLV